MPEFQPQSLTCPCCSREFETQLVTGYRIGEKEYDFCPRYLDGNPLPNFLHVCPDCGYVGFEADYRHLKDEGKVQKVRHLLKGFHWENGQKLEGPDRYRRAALIGIYSGKKSAQIAELYLQATWCSRMDGEPDDEQKGARRKAVKYFELALASDEFSTDDLAVVHYLIGELSRRLGEDKKALLHFKKLDQLEKVDDWLIEWRNRQRKLIREPGGS